MVENLPSAGPGRGRRVGTVVFLVAIIVGAVVAITGSWPWRGEIRPAPLSQSSGDFSSSLRSRQELVANYVGAAACRECHPGESALYDRSGHAKTLRLAEQSPIIAWLNGKSVSDPKYPDIQWSYHVRDNRLVVERTTEGGIESLALDYSVGSGKHGVTFVAVQGEPTQLDPSGIEHRISYLANSPRLEVTPGQEANSQDPAHGGVAAGAKFGRLMGPDLLKTCLGCHATVSSAVVPHELGTSTLVPNISCERCHGPGREHVDAARKGETELTMPMGHEPAQPWAEVNRCGECHRLPRLVAGSSISPENSGIVRFQGIGISMSACYAKGEGSLRCTTCHDPHDRASSDHTQYAAACLSCHQSATAQKACPVSPAANCIGCHMPRREVRGNGVFTDHWIRKPTPGHTDPAKTEPVKTSLMLR